MVCYRPVFGWVSKVRNESGKRSIVFSLDEGFKDQSVLVPCGKCIGCRLERARQWSVRCMHEASLHDENCFVTLTYDDASVPKDGSLRPRDMTLFLKRLRERLGPFRYFQCGEYGGKLERPHHHALLFGLNFPDRVFWNKKLTTSVILDDTWSLGKCWIGSVTRQSAGYVARYQLKKVYGMSHEEWYRGRVPEYVTMSRRPGIGLRWIEKYWRDCYPNDVCVMDGIVGKPPRYYDEYLESKVPGGDVLMRRIKRKRMEDSRNDPDNRGHMMAMAEFVKSEQIKTLTRSLEV